MKIVVGVRTRNERYNIQRFCRAYSWVDEILIADGGSEDNTVAIATYFENVFVRRFPLEVDVEHGLTRNPHGEHLNFLIDWANEKNADWIIMDDCDCFPNKFVKENARGIMESTSMNYIYITRLYLWQDLGHFPKLAKPSGKDYVPSLWAWKLDAGLRFKEDTPPQEHQQLAFTPRNEEVLKLMPPFALLHCPWQNEEMVNRKLKFYRNSGEVPEMLHPLLYGGEIEPLPDWAIE